VIQLQGQALYPGSAKGLAKWIKKTIHPTHSLSNQDQRALLQKALKVSEETLTHEMNQMKETFPQHAMMMFEAHRLMIQDPFLLDRVEVYFNQGLSAYEAYKNAAQEVIELFEMMQNDYMRGRVVDIEDITDRVLTAISETELVDDIPLHEQTILLLDKLKPSLIAKLSQSSVVGILVKEASAHQHSLLLFDTLKIPCVVLGKDLDKIKNKDYIIINGTTGHVQINPDNGGESHEL